MSRRRFRVVLRPQARRRRAERFAAAAVVLMGLLALLVVRHFPIGRLGSSLWLRVLGDMENRAAEPSDSIRRRGDARRFLPRPSILLVRDVSVTGAPPALAEQMKEALGAPLEKDWGIVELYQRSRRLKSRFAWLSSVRLHWNLLRRSAVLEAVLQRPLARTLRNGARVGWLSDTGVLFDAPEAAFEQGPWVEVELRQYSEQDYLPLAQMLGGALKAGVLPSPLQRLEYRSAEEGWEAWLADGTQLKWGNLSWTPQKLERLRAVLADAGPKMGAGPTVDLRYFEYGKILASPSGVSSRARIHPPKFPVKTSPGRPGETLHPAVSVKI